MEKKGTEPGTVKVAQAPIRGTDGFMSALSWLDKKPVYMASSWLSPFHVIDIVRRTRKSERPSLKARHVLVQKPAQIDDYNQFMGGVDHANQERRLISIMLRTFISWKLGLFWIVDTAVWNASICFRELIKMADPVEPRVPSANFRLSLFYQLTVRHREARRSVTSYHMDLSPAEIRLHNVGEHFPAKAKKRSRCRECYVKGKERLSSYICTKCEVHLCVECFKPFHTDHDERKYQNMRLITSK